MESMEAIETNPAPLVKETPTDAPGGSRELLKLATPLIVSQSFMTVQVFVDTILLSWHDTQEMSASFPAMMWFWLLSRGAASRVSAFYFLTPIFGLAFGALFLGETIGAGDLVGLVAVAMGIVLVQRG